MMTHTGQARLIAFQAQAHAMSELFRSTYVTRARAIVRWTLFLIALSLLAPTVQAAATHGATHSWCTPSKASWLADRRLGHVPFDARSWGAKHAHNKSKRTRRGCPIHEVRKGDSLIKIAKKYNVKVKALLEHNGLRKQTPLQLGQRLEIPIESRWCKPHTREEVSSKRSSTGSGRSGWRARKPPPWTQTQRTSKERGVNPCNTPDHGFGVYDKWSRAPSIGQMIAPQSGGVTRSGGFDVMFHFHGHEAVRKEWVRVMRGAVLVGIDLGLGSGPYQQTFKNPAVFKRLVRSVEKAMAKKTGKKNAHARKIGLSAWSAGYGAVESILRSPQTRGMIDSVVLLDGMHCGYEGDGRLERRQLEPFLWFARQAVRRRKFMFVSHSSIIPPGYASTTETAEWLIHQLGGKPRHRHPRGGDPMGLELISRYDRGNFHVRGFKGNDKMDHCAHIGLYRDILKVHIKRRWRSPRGRKRRAAKR